MLASYEETREALGGISESTLRRLIRAGDLPAVKIGRRVMIARDALNAFVQERQKPADPAPLERQGRCSGLNPAARASAEVGVDRQTVNNAKRIRRERAGQIPPQSKGGA